MEKTLTAARLTEIIAFVRNLNAESLTEHEANLLDIINAQTFKLTNDKAKADIEKDWMTVSAEEFALALL